MTVAADAGPLIALARIGRFGLLHAVYGELHIPEAVHEEITRTDGLLPGAAELAPSAWIHVAAVRDRTAVLLLRGALDAGESEAIVLALEIHADMLLMDERKGRRMAEAYGLKKTGTAGTLVLAKRGGLIPSITPLLDELLRTGFRMSPALYRAARALAGEC